MYFFKQRGKQCLDLRGDLILSHNANVITARIKSAAPTSVKNAKHICGIPAMGFYRKLKATRAAIAFIWGPSQELSAETIESEGL